jgi:arylsulfatase A-like enzyme
MNLRIFSLVGLAWLGISASLCAAQKAPSPNIVFIISDDHAWNDYGFMGHPHIATPRLDRLAGESITFHRGYTPVPLCRPSLASIITGLYPHQHGVPGNDPALPDADINPQRERQNPRYAHYYETLVANFTRQPNLVRDLVSRGYVALQTGKWWEGEPVQSAGFTHAMTRGQGKGARHGDDGLAIGRTGMDPIRQFIAEADGKPFFIWYAPFLPHTPHTPPDELLQKYLKLAPTEAAARYWACVEWFDRTCGELLDHLEAKGLLKNTIVIYTCDNGWIQDPEKPNRFAPRSKQTAYEGGVRTPIMISWPGRLKPRQDTQHLASNVDLWPTIAGLLEIPAPRALPGINLADARAVSRRTRIFGEQYTHDIADVNAPARSLQHRWMIEGWWKLLAPDPRNRPGEPPALYDLRHDPWENNNLANRESRRVRKMLARLDDWWTPEPVR